MKKPELKLTCKRTHRLLQEVSTLIVNYILGSNSRFSEKFVQKIGEEIVKKIMKNDQQNPWGHLKTFKGILRQGQITVIMSSREKHDICESIKYYVQTFSKISSFGQYMSGFNTASFFEIICNM